MDNSFIILKYDGFSDHAMMQRAHSNCRGGEQKDRTKIFAEFPDHISIDFGYNTHEQACQQHCSSWPVQPCSSLSTILFKLANSTMFKPVNRQKETVRFYVCTTRSNQIAKKFTRVTVLFPKAYALFQGIIPSMARILLVFYFRYSFSTYIGGSCCSWQGLGLSCWSICAAQTAEYFPNSGQRKWANDWNDHPKNSQSYVSLLSVVCPLSSTPSQ